MVELRRQTDDNNKVVDEAAIYAQILDRERNSYIPDLRVLPRKGHSQFSSQVEA